MTPETWQRVKATFDEVVVRTPKSRALLLERMGEDAPGLRVEVERLLRAHETVADFLKPPSGSGVMPGQAGSSAAAVPERLGAYRVVRTLGEGGMGTVYLADQEHPRRQVAVKVIRAAAGDAAAAAVLVGRFEHEAEVLGRLQHPGIARIYESGSATLGGVSRPFFAMEYIEGRTLIEHAIAAGLGVRERVELFARVCDAVHYAHQRGVIHRDLKPGNILVDESVGAEAGGAQPKVLDFGVARAVDPLGGPGQQTTVRTGVAQIVGTMRYMSPEQVSGETREVDVRSDVYALGVILYELLTGRLPYSVEGKGLAETARIIREEMPAPASATRRELRGDLQTVLSEALGKEKEHRYQSAAELGADLRRWLAGEPIAARPPTAMHVLQAFARRHRALSGGVAGAVVVLVVASGVLAWQMAAAMRDRDRAVAAELLAQQRLERVFASAAEATEVVEQHLAVLPGATRVRESMARRALAELRTVARDMPNDPGAWHRLAYALQRVGEVALVMGRTAEADAMFREALELRERQAAAHPGEMEFQRPLGVGLWKVSEVELTMGMLDQAEAHNRRSLAIHESMAAQGFDTDADRGVYLGIGHRRIGDVLMARGRHAEAVEAYRTSVERTIAGLVSVPTNRQLRRDRALTLRLLGEALAAAGREEEAGASFRESLGLVEELRRDAGGENLWERANAARGGAAMTDVLGRTGRVGEAVEMARGAVAEATALTESDPDNNESRVLLARCLIAEAGALTAVRRTDEACHRAERAVQILEECCKADPVNARMRSDLIRSIVAAGTAFRAMARSDGASEEERARAEETAKEWERRLLEARSASVNRPE